MIEPFVDGFVSAVVVINWVFKESGQPLSWKLKPLQK